MIDEGDEILKTMRGTPLVLATSAPRSASLDNALIMRDVAHEWRPLPALDIDGY